MFYQEVFGLRWIQFQRTCFRSMGGTGVDPDFDVFRSGCIYLVGLPSFSVCRGRLFSFGLELDGGLVDLQGLRRGLAGLSNQLGSRVPGLTV